MPDSVVVNKHRGLRLRQQSARRNASCPHHRYIALEDGVRKLVKIKPDELSKQLNPGVLLSMSLNRDEVCLGVLCSKLFKAVSLLDVMVEEAVEIHQGLAIAGTLVHS